MRFQAVLQRRVLGGKVEVDGRDEGRAATNAEEESAAGDKQTPSGSGRASR